MRIREKRKVRVLRKQGITYDAADKSRDIKGATTVQYGSKKAKGRAKRQGMRVLSF